MKNKTNMYIWVGISLMAISVFSKFLLKDLGTVVHAIHYIRLDLYGLVGLVLWCVGYDKQYKGE